MTPAVKEAFDRLYASIRSEIIDDLREKTAPAPVAPPEGKRSMRPQGTVDQIADRMLAHITTTPGQSMGQIRKAMNLSAADAQFPMRKLRESKKVLIKGSRAAARYYPKNR